MLSIEVSVHSSRMLKARPDFAWLLDPVARHAFFDRHWEKQPLHLRRSNAGYYDELLTIGDLEEFVASPLARYPSIQLSKGGAYFPPEVYSEDIKFGSNDFTGVPNVQKIAAEYRAGATIVLPALHRTWMPLRALCANIESELNHVVHANAYITRGNTAGFTPHYDTHEVLVLQIAGQKHWRIYDPPIELPHRKQPFSPIGYTPPARAMLEVDLSPGDLLYLPRGHVHTTTTSDSRSAHVTIGVAVYTWLDLAGELLQSAMTSPQFRKALPPGFASRNDAKAALAGEFNRVLDQLRNNADSDGLIEMFLSRVRSTKTSDRGAFRSDGVVIEPGTPLQAPLPELYRIVPQGSKVAVEFEQRRLIFPAETWGALKCMRQMRVFKTVDLPGAYSIDTKLTLVRTLFEHGFLSTPSGS